MSRTYLTNGSGIRFYIENNPALVQKWTERGFSVEANDPKPEPKASEPKPKPKRERKATARKE